MGDWTWHVHACTHTHKHSQIQIYTRVHWGCHSTARFVDLCPMACPEGEGGHFIATEEGTWDVVIHTGSYTHTQAHTHRQTHVHTWDASPYPTIQLCVWGLTKRKGDSWSSHLVIEKGSWDVLMNSGERGIRESGGRQHGLLKRNKLKILYQ